MLPLAPLPERELCEYEKIRENNIEQRKKEWAVKEAEWEAEWEKKNSQYLFDICPLAYEINIKTELYL